MEKEELPDVFWIKREVRVQRAGPRQRKGGGETRWWGGEGRLGGGVSHRAPKVGSVFTHPSQREEAVPANLLVLIQPRRSSGTSPRRVGTCHSGIF